jgi:hypothetical protein
VSFEAIGFTSLFHDGFRIDAEDLVIHLALENRIRPYAERVLLTRFAFSRSMPPRPRVTKKEVATRFDAMRVELDYLEASRTHTFLDECGVTLERVDEAIKTDLAIEKLVDRFIAGLGRDASGREAICVQAFLDLELRGHVVRAVALGLLADGADGRGREPSWHPGEEATTRARQHLLVKHGCAEWPDLIAKLEGRWGLDTSLIERFVSRYAAAFEGTARTAIGTLSP